MPARAPILRTKNLQRTGNLRTYFRGTLNPSINANIDLGVPRNQYTQENLSLVPITGSQPWMNTIKLAFRSSDPGGVGNPEGNLGISRFIPPSSSSALLSTQTDSFSFVLRIKFNSFPSRADDQIIFTNGRYLQDGYALVAHGDVNGDDQRLYFVVGDTSTPIYFQVSNAPLGTDFWYTIAVSRPIGMPPQVYINGTLQTTVPGNNPTILTPAGGTFWFNESSGTASGFAFVGDLAEFIFYDSLLTTSYFFNSFQTAPFG